MVERLGSTRQLGQELGFTARAQSIHVSPSCQPGSPLMAASVSSPGHCCVHQDILAGSLWRLQKLPAVLCILPPPRARATLLLTQQVQPLVLLFTPSSLESPVGMSLLSPASFQAGLCPLSLMACGDARLSDHMSPIYKFLAPFSSAATQGPLLPPVRCQHPHSSSVIGFPLCSLAL